MIKQRPATIAILILGILTMLLAVNECAHADDGELEAKVERQTSELATVMCDIAASPKTCPAPAIVVVVHERDRMPKLLTSRGLDDVLAYTTHDLTPSSESCVIHFFPGKDSLGDSRIVAHEACHCALDYHDIGWFGFVGLDRTQIDQREERARECAARLVRIGRGKEVR